MMKWPTAFVLLVALTGSALAGVPLHSGENGCPMSGTPDCCATAQAQSSTPEVRAARLCCALNCTGTGTPGQTVAYKFSPTINISLRSATIPAPVLSLALLRSCSAQEHQQNSHPAYIRHLALLI